jgi:aromatic ring-opening dioxygenase LigB subunit
VLSLPNRRHDGSGAAMTDDLLQLGTKLFKFFHSRTERTAVILSSDLAHTHSKTGPYGFTNAAAPFDTAIRRWAVDPIRNSHSLLKRARSLVARALSCGYPSLVIWHAMMTQLPRSHWECGTVAYAAPTYYGMLVATFRNINDAGQSQRQPPVEKPLREWELE